MSKVTHNLEVHIRLGKEYVKFFAKGTAQDFRVCYTHFPDYPAAEVVMNYDYMQTKALESSLSRFYGSDFPESKDVCKALCAKIEHKPRLDPFAKAVSKELYKKFGHFPDAFAIECMVD